VAFPKWLPIIFVIALTFGCHGDAAAQQQRTISIILTQPLTDTGLQVVQGQIISVTASGSLNWFTGGCPVAGACVTTPAGQTCPYIGFYAQGLPCWSLIGQIGNGVPFEVGTSLQNFSAPNAGELYLGVNDTYYPDNTGSWIAVVSLALPPCSITSRTLATVPGIEDSRTRIGVGESVELELATPEPATWTITSTSGEVALTQYLTATKDFPPNEGFPSQECSSDGLSQEVFGAQACFTAPSTSSTVVIKATSLDCSSASQTFTVLPPNWLLFQRLHPRGYGPDFFLFAFGLQYRIQMESAVFVIPGDVSFANVLFKEKDVPSPRSGERFNALLNVGGTNAWLVSCDKDIDYHDTKNEYGQDIDPIDPKEAYWVYENNNREIPFSFVQTEWSREFVGAFADYEYTKRQVDAISENGTFVATPSAASAVLNLPAIPPFFFWDDVKVANSPESCLNMVKAQF
jgi:hypothetical protein